MNSPIDEIYLLTKLSDYPLSHHCFAPYVQWICRKVPGDRALTYDFIRVLVQEQNDGLEGLEECLVRSKDILGLNDDEFVRAFGFKGDLLTPDPQKIHDLIAEPLVIIDLRNNGFQDIEKICKPIQYLDVSKPTADFLAKHNGLIFAVEVKTVRMEHDIESGKPLGNAMMPYWWGQMFRNNAITKIEDKQQRVIQQLNNTARHFQCNRKMIVLFIRRLGPSTLLSRDEVIFELENLSEQYNEIDHFCARLVSGEVYFYPELTKV